MRTRIRTEHIPRTRHRNTARTADLLGPEAVRGLRLNLWATANVFRPGDRVRLEVSSSNVPRFGRSCRTGGDIASEPASAYRPAVNRVFHDATRPSRPVLPVVER